MSPIQLFNYLCNQDYYFTKPYTYKERQDNMETSLSMQNLVAIGLAEKVEKNRFTLSQEGIIAKSIGIDKWKKTVKNKNTILLVNHSFGIKTSWYNFPKLKAIIERIISSTISKHIWFVIRSVIALLIAYTLWAMFGDSILRIFNR